MFWIEACAEYTYASKELPKLNFCDYFVLTQSWLFRCCANKNRIFLKKVVVKKCAQPLETFRRVLSVLCYKQGNELH